jgi:murein DD-endopeptidase MepM/ murein hydrolase activator NlpD
MSRTPPELFSRDLKFLVEANPPHTKRRSGNHSHWLATGLISLLVVVWIGSDPSASIVIDNPRQEGEERSGLMSGYDEPLLDDLLVFEQPGLRPEMAPQAAPTAQSKSLDAMPSNPSPVAPDSWGALDDVPLSGIEFQVSPGQGKPWTSGHVLFDSFFESPGEALTDARLRPVDSHDALVPPSLELATGFEEQQSDIEVFVLSTDFDLSALDARGGSGWNVIDIKQGDTFGGIFRRLGVDPETTHRLVQDENGRLLNSLQTGPNLKVLFRQDGSIEALQYNVDPARILTARFDNGGVSTGIEHRKITVREREVVAHIKSSLFQAGAAAGLSDQFILRLAAIFKWNIDFSKDLQPGDRFSVIFEEKFIEDRKIATGGIVAAAFKIGNKKYTAVRHVESDGTISYFSADGESLKRAFLRSPVKFSRISSHFSPKRFHPVLKKWRAHNGVDYAASRGTPVLATADGIVALAGQNGGYGKTVIIQHGREYSTLYAHLDQIGKGLKKGARIRQGQVIGHVGSTGLATGPHLHYEFRVNGEHKDPLTVNVPRALPIAGSEREEFLRVAGNIDLRLTNLLN